MVDAIIIELSQTLPSFINSLLRLAPLLEIFYLTHVFSQPCALTEQHHVDDRTASGLRGRAHPRPWLAAADLAPRGDVQECVPPRLTI